MQQQDWQTVKWEMVDDDQQLARLCESWMDQPQLAIDTEFMRVTTFFPHAGLIQIADDKQCYLIDPLEISDWGPFSDVLTSPDVVKVFHAPKEDLEVFKKLLGAIPKPIFDTQLAGAIAGLGGIMGLQRLIKELKGIEIPKDQTRSDWLKRPLSPQQLQYAVLDVYYLLEVVGLIKQKLAELSRDEWFAEEMANFEIQAEKDIDPDEMYKDIKLAWKLKPQDLNVLRGLVAWRDKTAKSHDKPRGHVIPDVALSWLAMRKPQTIEQLKKIHSLPAKNRQKHGDDIMAVIGAAVEQPKTLWPEKLPKPMNPQMGEWFKELKSVVNQFAESKKVPAEVVARKGPLKELLESGYPDGPFIVPDSMKGWREQQLLPMLMDKLTEMTNGQ